MRRHTIVPGLLLLLALTLLAPAAARAQAFATPAAVVQLKAWLFDKPGKAAKLGKAVFVLEKGALGRRSAGGAPAAILPAYAFAAVNGNTSQFLAKAIKTCKMTLKAATTQSVPCQKFSQNVEGVNVVGWIAFPTLPIVADGKLTAIVTRRGGSKSPAGSAAIDTFVAVNNGLLATSAQARQVAVQMAAEQIYKEALRITRDRGLPR